MKSFNAFLAEASILQSKYPPGALFILKDFAGLQSLSGWKSGDVLEVVTNKEGEPDLVSRGFSKDKDVFEKTLKGQDGKTFKIASNSEGSFGGNFKKAGGAVGPSGEDWEALITVGLIGVDKSEGTPEWDRIERFWGNYSDEAIKMGKLVGKALNISTMNQTGNLSTSLTQEWKSWGGKNATPKTDMLSGKHQISLKKAGGSQLMSAKAPEAEATFNAALISMSTMNPKSVEKIVSLMQDKMGEMQRKGTISSLQALRDSGKKLSKQDEADIAQMEGLQLNAKELNAEFDKFFQNIKFKSHFAFEAATGESKFGKGNWAVANQILEFDPAKGKITKHLTMHSAKDAEVLARSNSFYVSFKTGGGGSKPYLSMRTKKTKIPANYKSVFESNNCPIRYDSEFVTLNDILEEELSKCSLGRHVLSEGVEQLDEFGKLKAFYQKAKRAAGGIKDSAIKILQVVWQRITEAFNFIKKLGSKMLHGLMSFLGISIGSVSVDEKSDLGQLLYGA